MVHVVILAPETILFEGQARHVILPGEEGVFEVGSFHRPLVSRLLPGVILVDEQPIPILRGVVGIQRDRLAALVEPDRAGATAS